jgi:hypothetical protein
VCTANKARKALCGIICLLHRRWNEISDRGTPEEFDQMRKIVHGISTHGGHRVGGVTSAVRVALGLPPFTPATTILGKGGAKVVRKNQMNGLMEHKQFSADDNSGDQIKKLGEALLGHLLSSSVAAQRRTHDKGSGKMSGEQENEKPAGRTTHDDSGSSRGGGRRGRTSGGSNGDSDGDLDSLDSSAERAVESDIKCAGCSKCATVYCEECDETVCDSCDLHTGGHRHYQGHSTMSVAEHVRRLDHPVVGDHVVAFGEVPDHAARGRTIKCLKCKHYWTLDEMHAPGQVPANLQWVVDKLSAIVRICRRHKSLSSRVCICVCITQV